ncbi:MAG: curli production assembly protein CsgG [Acidobacteria bacterium]|nr:curli production assembly protein CsgG [Acidobacteriota bacterium]
MQRFAVLTALCAVFSSGALAQQKKRVAVLDFDYATVSSSVAAIFQTNVDVGKGIADLIVDRLVRDGQYSVIERKAISKIMAEQNFSNSDRADASSAAKIGRLLGVEAIIIGSITQFGRDDKTTSVGGGALGGITGRYGLGGVGKRQAKAVVGISARLVSTDTGEILSVASGTGQSNRSGTTLLGAGGSSGGGGGGAYDMSSKNFGDTILGEAVGQAVDGLSRQLEASASKLPTHVVKIEGLVADATGDTLVLNLGTKAGLKVGDKLEVKRAGREIRDPSTGRVIRRIEQALGSATVTEADELSAVAKYSGAEPAKVGDVVRNSQ